MWVQSCLIENGQTWEGDCGHLYSTLMWLMALLRDVKSPSAYLIFRVFVFPKRGFPTVGKDKIKARRRTKLSSDSDLQPMKSKLELFEFHLVKRLLPRNQRVGD